VSGFGRIVLLGAMVATVAGISGLRAQTQLADPRDAPRIFASTCSACHKSPQGLAKSGQVAGFLRQHYTTGPEMSAAMAAYLVAAGSAPARKDREKAAAAGQSADPAAKSRKQEQAAAQSGVDAKDQRSPRGKQLQAKSPDDRGADRTAHPAPVHPSPASATDAVARQPTAAAPVVVGDRPQHTAVVRQLLLGQGRRHAPQRRGDPSRTTFDPMAGACPVHSSSTNRPGSAPSGQMIRRYNWFW